MRQQNAISPWILILFSTAYQHHLRKNLKKSLLVAAAFSTLKTESLSRKSLLSHYYKRWDSQTPSHRKTWFYSLKLANTIWQRTKISFLHNKQQPPLSAAAVFSILIFFGSAVSLLYSLTAVRTIPIFIHVNSWF